MELKEARDWAKCFREVEAQKQHITWAENAAMILDDRVTELESESIALRQSRDYWLEKSGRLRAQQGELVKALEEISKGEGAFDMNPLTHAAACIQSMKSLAEAVVAKAKEGAIA